MILQRLAALGYKSRINFIDCSGCHPAEFRELSFPGDGELGEMRIEGVKPSTMLAW